MNYPKNHASLYLACIAANLSDHNAVELNINLRLQNGNELTIEKEDSQTCLSYKKTNWLHFQTKIKQKLRQSDIIIPNNKNLDVDEIDVSINNITEVINDTMNIMYPKIHTKQSQAHRFTTIHNKSDQ